MKKKEFISKVTEVLKENNMRKPVAMKKHTFHITDNEGNSADFNIRQQDKRLLYTVDDITNVIDACIAVVLDSLKNGEEISIKGFGTIGLHYRAARRTKEPYSGQWCDIDAHYVPKFSYGTDLRMAAKLYECSLKAEYPDLYNVYDVRDSDQDFDIEDGE